MNDKRWSWVGVVLAMCLAAWTWAYLSPPVAASPLASPLVQDAEAAAATRSVVDGVFTSRQAARGEQQFQQTCAACHAPNEHTGRRFFGAWGGSTLGDWIGVVSVTMPESNPGSLSSEEFASVLAFFLRESGYPSGDRELPGDAEALKGIRIEPPPEVAQP